MREDQARRRIRKGDILVVRADHPWRASEPWWIPGRKFIALEDAATSLYDEYVLINTSGMTFDDGRSGREKDLRNVRLFDVLNDSLDRWLDNGEKV